MSPISVDTVFADVPLREFSNSDAAVSPLLLCKPIAQPQLRAAEIDAAKRNAPCTEPKTS